jgi:hypothetical protein
MAHLTQQSIGAIIDNYADAIEGGNRHNSGTSYRGIPGTFTNDERIRTGVDNTITADGAGDTTTIAVSTGDWPQGRWKKTNSPGFFLVCTSGADQAVSAGRRITDWDNTAKEFTTDAFPVAPGDTATFNVYQGFRRLPNNIDIDGELSNIPLGGDRFFDIALLPQERSDYLGNGVETWNGNLRVRLRLVNFSRLHDSRARVAENLTIIASALTRSALPDHRDGTYTRALLPPIEAPELIVDDDQKTVMALDMPIVYRVDRTFF